MTKFLVLLFGALSYTGGGGPYPALPQTPWELRLGEGKNFFSECGWRPASRTHPFRRDGREASGRTREPGALLRVLSAACPPVLAPPGARTGVKTCPCPRT